jgi:hypothetical protein
MKRKDNITYNRCSPTRKARRSESVHRPAFPLNGTYIICLWSSWWGQYKVESGKASLNGAQCVGGGVVVRTIAEVMVVLSGCRGRMIVR